jgi:DNA-binding transcriptional ArsR family regulator
MSHQFKVHSAQTSILRELLFQVKATYSQLQKPTGLSSDHFNFHVKRLVELGLVEKLERGKYQLSSRGKEYANKLDTDQNIIELQPKSAVILAIVRTIQGKKEYLFQERLKHPYYGYWGFPTGKIRWGETVLQTAARELLEETGLTANLKFMGIYHEHAYQKESDELLEDKLFYVIKCENVTGKLIEKFEGGRNAWMSTKTITLKKVFNSYLTELEVAEGKHQFIEQIQYYSKEEF